MSALKGNKKGILMSFNSKMKTRDNVGSLLTRARDLVRKATKKAEELSALFTTVFKAVFMRPRSLKPEGEDQERGRFTFREGGSS